MTSEARGVFSDFQGSIDVYELVACLKVASKRIIVSVEGLRLRGSNRLTFHVKQNQQRNRKTLHETDIASINTID